MAPVDHSNNGIADARALVRSLAPKLGAAELHPASGGSSKIVWHVGEEHILRIPLHVFASDAMQVERRLLTRLHGTLGLATPLPIAVDNARGCDLCQMAPGRPLDWKQWAQLGAAEKAKLALPFAHFLARLHAEIPADEANALGVPDYVVPNIETLSDRLAKRLGSPARLRLLDSVTAAVPSMAAPGPPLVLLHNDFSHHNIGFDLESSEAVGVFDFGSAFVGDLHRDLRYDPGIPIADDTVVRTYEALSGVQVSRPRQRAWHALSALENLAYSLDHEGPELQAARWGWVDAVAAWDLGFFDAL
jgi:aminoglycoside phosphotransferase (APT) family kinase protein